MKIIIDTETTGLDTFEDEILELCIIDRDAGEVLYNQRFRPIRHEDWPAARRVNHIYPEDVAECPTFSDCRDEIQREWIRGADWVGGWNVAFDITMLENSGLLFQSGCAFDIMKEDAYICGEFFGDRPPKYRKLMDAATFWGWFTGENMAYHTAYTDCMAARAVYRLINEYKADQESTFREMVQIRDELQQMNLLLHDIHEETLRRMQKTGSNATMRDLHDMSEAIYKYRMLLEQRARIFGVKR